MLSSDHIIHQNMVPLSVSHQCKTAHPQKPVKYVLAIAKLYRSLLALYWLVLDCLITLYTGLLLYNHACVDLEEGGGIKKKWPLS